METLRKERFNSRVMLFIIFYGMSIASFIRTDETLFSIWDILIACCFFLVQINQHQKSRVSAVSYQISVLVNLLCITIINFHTAVRHAQIISYPSWIVFIIIGVLPIIGLLLQIQLYKNKLVDSIPEIIQLGKYDDKNQIWNIGQRLETKSMEIKEGGQRILNWIKYLSYFAPGLGMLTSRKLDSYGQSLSWVYFFLFLYALFLIGLALPIAELWLIKNIQKERMVTIYI